jgi:hypothetical protein
MKYEIYNISCDICPVLATPQIFPLCSLFE